MQHVAILKRIMRDYMLTSNYKSMMRHLTHKVKGLTSNTLLCKI